MAIQKWRWIASMLLVGGFANNLAAQDFLKALQDKILPPKAAQSAQDAPKQDSEPPFEGESEALPPPKPIEPASPTNPFLLPDDAPPNSSSLDIGSPLPLGNPDVAAGPIELPNGTELPGDQMGDGYLGIIAEQSTGGGMGLKVVEVAMDSPAWKAGFQVGDKIMAVDGKAIRNLDDLATQIKSRAINQPTRILVNRNGRNMEMVVVMMDRSVASRIGPADAPLRSSTLFGSQDGNQLNNREVNPADAVARSGPPLLGVNIASLNLQSRRELGVPVYRGAAITNVSPGTPADQVGIRVGDCVVQANGRVIQSSSDLQELVTAMRSGDTLRLVMYRQRDLFNVAVRLGEAVDARVNYPPDTPWSNGIDLNSEYVQSLEAELARVRRDLLDTQLRLRQLENQINDNDRRRRR